MSHIKSRHTYHPPSASSNGTAGVQVAGRAPTVCPRRAYKQRMNNTGFWVVFLTCVGLVLLIVSANLNSSLQLEMDPPVRALNFHAQNVLDDYLLIGTHGSAAYQLEPTVLVEDRGYAAKKFIGIVCPELVKTWSLNQHYTVYGQLALGARYLHLEVAVHNGTWVTLHSYRCGDLRHELSDIQRFLACDTHPDIFALVYFQVFGEQQVDANGNDIQEVVKHQLGASLFAQPIGKMTRIEDLTQKLVMLTDASLEQYPADWTHDVEEFDRHRTPTHMRHHPPANAQCMLCLTWVMTPHVTQMLAGAVKFWTRSGIFSMETQNTRKLQTFLQDNSSYVQQFSILLVDHLTPATVDLIWSCPRKTGTSCKRMVQ